MNFRKILVDTAIELGEHYIAINELFSACFEEELDKSLWEWAYLNNVNGDPIVSLYYDGDRLIGHYAIIPVKLRYNDTALLSGLSMTTMVDPAYRRHGVFVKQASEVYERAIQLGFDLVYGFPNKNSAPGFKKRLGWVIDDTGCVVKVNKNEMLTMQMGSQNCIYFDTNDKDLMEWRLSKPGQKYLLMDGAVMKKYDDGYDVLAFENNQSFENNVNYNVLVFDGNKHASNKLFDYCFGSLIFNDELTDLCVKKEMIMSDVF